MKLPHRTLHALIIALTLLPLLLITFPTSAQTATLTPAPTSTNTPFPTATTDPSYYYNFLTSSYGADYPNWAGVWHSGSGFGQGPAKEWDGYSWGYRVAVHIPLNNSFHISQFVITTTGSGTHRLTANFMTASGSSEYSNYYTLQLRHTRHHCRRKSSNVTQVLLGLHNGTYGNNYITSLRIYGYSVATPTPSSKPIAHSVTTQPTMHR